MISVLYCTFLLGGSTFPKIAPCKRIDSTEYKLKSNGVEIRAEDTSYDLHTIDECNFLLGNVTRGLDNSNFIGRKTPQTSTTLLSMF